MHKQIWEYDTNEQDEIRRAYIKLGPYQPKLEEYKKTKFGRHSRKFKHSWFAIKEFSTWLTTHYRFQHIISTFLFMEISV